jgi:signal transduction histidine kinase
MLAESELKLVFQRFHRVASTARSIEGTGMSIDLAFHRQTS